MPLTLRGPGSPESELNRPFVPILNRRRRRAAPGPPPTEEEESSLLNKTLAGVSYLGLTLDKPGAAVRGTISGLTGGDWGGGLLNLLPFSDTMGITEPKERVYGADLLEQWGILDADEKPGFQWNDAGDWGRGAAGFATDVLLDPLTYVGLGAASKAAKGATEGVKMTGKNFGKVTKMFTSKGASGLEDVVAHTPTTFASALRSGERSVVSIRAPFAKKPVYEFGAMSGKVGEKVAGAAASTLHGIAYGRLSPVHAMRGLLSAAATGALDVGKRAGRVTLGGYNQILNDLLYSSAKAANSGADNMIVAANDGYRDLIATYEGISKHAKNTGDQRGFDEFVQAVARNPGGMPDPDEFAARMGEFFKDTPKDLPDAMGKLEAFQREMAEFTDNLGAAVMSEGAEVRSLGLKLGVSRDIYEPYVPRHSSSAREAAEWNRAMHNLSGKPRIEHSPAIQRNPALVDAPGGSSTINLLAKNMRMWGYYVEEGTGVFKALDKKARIAGLEDWALNNNRLDLVGKGDLRALQQAYGESIIKKALNDAWANGPPPGLADEAITLETETVKWLGEGPRNATTDLLDELFGLSPETQRANIRKDMKGKSKATQAMLQTKFDRIGNGIWERGVFDGSVVEDAAMYLKYSAFQKSIGRSTHNFLAQKGMVGTAQTMPDAASLHKAWTKAGFTDQGLHRFVKENADKLGVDVAELADPNKAAGILDSLRIAPGAEGALEQYGLVAEPRVTNAIFRLADRVTSLYKASLYNYWGQSHSRDVMSDVWRVSSEGHAPIWGPKKNGIIHAMEDQVAFMQRGTIPPEMNALIDSGVVRQFVAQDIAMNPAGARALNRLPEPGKGVVSSLLETRGGSWNPFKMPGIMDPEKIAAGEPMGKMSEIANNVQNAKAFIVQGGYFIALLRNGKSPGQAKYLVERAFFTEPEMSRFTRDVASRVVPFWRFSSHNIPYIFKAIFDKPGGAVAQTVRAMTQTASQADPTTYTPEFLAETQAVPVGGTPEAQTFYRNTVLPLNDFNMGVFKSSGMPNLVRTSERAMAMMHPLALLFPELKSNKQFFSGRKISDLDSPTKAWFGVELPTVDRFLHYSPASRLVSELRSSFDPRKTAGQKAMNLLGLGNLSTYDTEAIKLRDIRNAAGKQLGEWPESRSWETFFLPKGTQEEMDPLEVAKFRELVGRRGDFTEQLGALYKSKKPEAKP